MNARKFIYWLVFVLVTGNLALMAWVLMGTPKPKPQPLPNPNGYDDFVKAGKILNGNFTDTNGHFFDFRKKDRDALTVLVSQNAEVLQLLRTGLSRECRVSLAVDFDYSGKDMQDLVNFKKEAVLLCAEGNLQESNGRTNDAIQAYLDGARLGHESGRGGVIIQRLVGVACETIALRELSQLSDKLDAKQCAEIARKLEQIDGADEPVAETIRNEDVFNRKTESFQQKLVALAMREQLRAEREKATKKCESAISNRRRVMLTFAARAYELDHGKRAASVADLVPGYLKTIPQDPATGTNTLYNP